MCYAVRNDQFRLFLLHSKVLVVTDHSSLCHLLSRPHLRSQRQERYALDLMELDVEIVHRPGALNELADMLSRAKIEHDEEALKEELEKLLHLQAERLEKVVAEPGSQVHHWQSVLANRGNFQIPGAAQVRERMGHDNADKLRLQCLIRGAKLNEDTGYSSITDMVAAMAEQQAETLWCQASTEYSRAAEMYSYVAVALRSQMKAAPTPPAPTLNAKPTHFTKAADAKVIGQSTMVRIHQRLGH